MCRLLSWWRVFSVGHILYCGAFPACTSLSPVDISPMFLQAKSQKYEWAPELRGRGKKIAFPWAGSRALTSVMLVVVLMWSRTEMGEIMIVWCSGGGENGGRSWVIHYSGAGSLSNRTPPKTGKLKQRWLMFLPSLDWFLHHGNTETLMLNVFRTASLCADIMVYVLRQTYTPYQLHWDVCFSVSQSDSVSSISLDMFYGRVDLNLNHSWFNASENPFLFTFLLLDLAIFKVSTAILWGKENIVWICIHCFLLRAAQ